MNLRALFLMGAAAALHAQTIPPDDLLSRARELILSAIDRMPSYTCTQTVDRSEFEVIPRAARASCDQILANRTSGVSRRELVRTDRLRLEVEVTDQGAEIFSWPGESRMPTERIQEFAAEGLIGTGSFGPFLINIFARPGVRFWREGVATIDGRELRQYRYLVPLESSRYHVGAAGETRIVPFDGRFWVDPESFELRRLLVRTGELSRSTGNCEGATTIDFTRARIGQGEHLLASRSLLHVVRRDAAELENVTTYAACREFRGESAIHFGDPVEAPATGSPPLTPAAVKSPAAPFPPGVRITVHLAGGIDSATSAAGDPMPARVTHTEATPKKRHLPPSGAAARCRITRLENDVRNAQLNATIACEAVELDGRWVALALVPDRAPKLLDVELLERTRDGTSERTVTRARRNPAKGAAFAFPLVDGRARVGRLAFEAITTAPAR
jgi:hypothetical protein